MAARLRGLGWVSLVHEAGQKDYKRFQRKGEHHHRWLLTSEIYTWGSLVHEAGQKDYKGYQVKGYHLEWMPARLRDLGWGSLVHEAGQKGYKGCQVKGYHLEWMAAHLRDLGWGSLTHEGGEEHHKVKIYRIPIQGHSLANGRREHAPIDRERFKKRYSRALLCFGIKR